jgi:hypothetical protein
MHVRCCVWSPFQLPEFRRLLNLLLRRIRWEAAPVLDLKVLASVRDNSLNRRRPFAALLPTQVVSSLWGQWKMVGCVLPASRWTGWMMLFILWASGHLSSSVEVAFEWEPEFCRGWPLCLLLRLSSRGPFLLYSQIYTSLGWALVSLHAYFWRFPPDRRCRFPSIFWPWLCCRRRTKYSCQPDPSELPSSFCRMLARHCGDLRAF